MIALLGIQGTGANTATITLPNLDNSSGGGPFTLIKAQGCGSDFQLFMAYRVAASDTPTHTYNFGFSSNFLISGGLTVFSGTSATTPLQTGAGAVQCMCTLASTTATAPSITTQGMNTLDVIAFGIAADATFVTPIAPVKEVYQETNTGNSPTIAQRYLQTSTSGTVIPAQVTMSNVAGDNVGCQFGVNSGP
jgi:hypothetical protein